MRLLLVDDNEISLEVQRLMLEGCGFEVVTASGGEEAVELAHDNDDFLVIFMDIRMPGMDGFTAAELIRKFDISVPIIALSADEIKDTDEDYIRCGMNGSLRKPLQQDALIDLLNHYISMKNAENKPKKQRINMIFSYDELLGVMRDEKAVVQVLQQFLSIHSGDCDKLCEFVANGNFIAAREIMHNIIGISGNMFCQRLYDASVRLSAELRKERSDSLEAYSKIWNMTLDELTECCEKHIGSESETENTDFWSLWGEFCDLCREFDVMASHIFMKNMSTFKKNMSAESFEKLKSAVEHYDFLWIIDNMEGLDVSSTDC